MADATAIIHISATPFIGKAEIGNHEPVTLYFNMQGHDGKFIQALSLDGFSASNSSRNFRIIEQPSGSNNLELSDLLKTRGDHVYMATLKPKKRERVTARRAGAGGPALETGGWKKGTYVLWLKIMMSPTTLRPALRTGSVLFQFEIK